LNSKTTDFEGNFPGIPEKSGRFSCLLKARPVDTDSSPKEEIEPDLKNNHLLNHQYPEKNLK